MPAKSLFHRARPVPTVDAVPLLLRGLWITDKGRALSASLVHGQVIVVPRDVPGQVAVSESAVFDLEDFQVEYQGLLWEIFS